MRGTTWGGKDKGQDGLWGVTNRQLWRGLTLIRVSNVRLKSNVNEGAPYKSRLAGILLAAGEGKLARRELAEGS